MADSHTGVAFDELKPLIDTHGRDTLEAAFAEVPGGVPAALDALFDTFAGSVDPELVGQDSGEFQFEIATAGGKASYVLEVDGATTKVRRGALDKPAVTLKLALPDVAAMAAGKLTGQDAYMTGKLDVQGDAMLGMKLGSWLS